MMESIMSPLRLPSPTLPLYPRDHALPDTPNINQNFREFKEIKDMFVDLDSMSGEADLEARRCGGAQGGDDQEGGAEN
ncbi:unnamed protein product [Ilex paraguariensis]|uniref:Uncharacterized protein n=1 Tax=Ilex paraguariensis TaxID=185542 RepID=A0ABC8R1K9_9AQUA